VRILFWGTPDFAVPALRALLGEGHEVVAVVTQPDRPAGRGRKPRPSPVKEAALDERIPVLTPEAPRGEGFLKALGALAPDISVVVAYGHILRKEVLTLPPRGSVNVHASLLPELRGAAPIHWAVVRGYDRTGVTIMEMTEGMDQGPILLQREVPIAPQDTASALHDRLAEVGAEALVEALALMEADSLEPREQDHERATYAPKVDRETARVEWSRPAREVVNLIRGMSSVPGAWSELAGKPIKLFQARLGMDGAEEGGMDGAGEGGPAGAGPGDGAPAEAPGTVLVADPQRGLVVAAGDGAVAVREVQPPGKRRMEARAWLRGGGPRSGDRFL
jgi:methionyl-tRNA formyltransferase